jgi:hypothetical protein
VRFLVLVPLLAYAVIDAFGAWAVIRRKPRIAGAFMVAAAVLTVAAVALGYGFGAAVWLTLAGVLLSSFASWLNALVVHGRVVIWHHLVRALLGGALLALVFLVLP